MDIEWLKDFEALVAQKNFRARQKSAMSANPRFRGAFVRWKKVWVSN